MTNNPFENPIPSPAAVDKNSDVAVLKSRLLWGEPAFTIIDVRDRQIYNQGHIMGALPMRMDSLADMAARSLSRSRNIYVYGASDVESTRAAQVLIIAGFENVSALKGGFAAWKAIGGPTGGIMESMTGC